MCFSAPASFIAGGVLATIGAVTVTKVENKRELPFAMLPLLFGLQQIAEGFVWLSLQGQMPGCNMLATNIFAFFAFAFWPMYIPFAVGFMETVSWRRIGIYITQVLGLMLGGYLLISHLIAPVTSQIVGHSIGYFDSTTFSWIPAVFYGLSTLVPFLLSSRWIVRIFGLSCFITALLAYWHYLYAFESIWCFFAAVLSLMICGYYLWKKTTKKVAATT